MNKRELRKLVCAMLLGDGYINPEGYSGAFSVDHSIAQEDYASWKADLIDNIFIKKELSKRCSRAIYTKQKIYKVYRFSLGWDEYIGKFLRPKVYKVINGKRQKNVEYLLEQIDSDLHLAIWFADDGGELNVRNKYLYRKPWYILCTHSFTKGQNELIRQWFKSRYGIIPHLGYLKRTDSNFLKFDKAMVEEVIFPRICPQLKHLESMQKKFKHSFNTLMTTEKAQRPDERLLLNKDEGMVQSPEWDFDLQP